MSVSDHHTVNLLFIIFLLIGVTGCFGDICFPIGGVPDPPSDSSFYGLKVDPGKDTTDTHWTEIFYDEKENRNYFSYDFNLNDAYLSISPNGQLMILKNLLYTIQPLEKEKLSESFSSFKFTHTGNPGKYILTSAVRDSMGNPHREMDSVSVKNHKTYLEIRNNPEIRGNLIATDTARFISENRYRIHTFSDPTLSPDDQIALYLHEIQTREVVIDSSGEVVDDFIYARKVEIRSVSTDSNPGQSNVLVRFKNVPENQSLPEIDISAEKRYASYAYQGTIYLVDMQTGKKQKLDEVTKPRFAPSKSLVMYQAKDENNEYDNQKIAKIYDLSSQTTTRVEAEKGGVVQPVWGPGDSQIYYTGQHYLKKFDPSTETHSKLMEFKDYGKRKEQAKSQDDLSVSFYIGRPRLVVSSSSISGRVV